MMAWEIRSVAAALALLLAGCAAGGTGAGSSNQIVVRLDPSIPDLNAATIVAQRDCSSRGGMAVLLSTQTAAAAGSPGTRTATFACDEIRRATGGGNNAMN
ncbi:MAG: hypothetical protein JNL66_03115 [Alphaproteobacteria bacterium]|nr:hypothetical protein [Alphaproteobacteria bacterium]